MPAGSAAAAGVAPVLGVLSGCSWLSPKSDTLAVNPRASSCGAWLQILPDSQMKVLSPPSLQLPAPGRRQTRYAILPLCDVLWCCYIVATS